MANQDTFRESGRGSNKGLGKDLGTESRNRSNLGTGGIEQQRDQQSSMKEMVSGGFEQISGRLSNINLGWKSVLSTIGVLGAIGAFSAFGVQQYRRGSFGGSSSTGGRKSSRKSSSGMKDLESGARRSVAGFKGGKAGSKSRSH
jgi:hypothetical protein